jgi:hypothetical protein
VSLRVVHSGERTPEFVWTSEHMRRFAVAMRSHFIRRTFDRGIGMDGTPHKPYSTRPLKVYSRSQTSRALGGISTPGPGAGLRGGIEFEWVRGPRKPGGGYDASRIGDVAGKFYVGGYREYKSSNRKGLVNSQNRAGTEVDLILTGQLAESIRVISSTRTQAVIGMTGNARTYGVHVDAARPFMGFSDDDHAEGQLILAEMMTMAQRKAAGGSRGSL